MLPCLVSSLPLPSFVLAVGTRGLGLAAKLVIPLWVAASGIRQMNTGGHRSSGAERTEVMRMSLTAGCMF